MPEDSLLRTTSKGWHWVSSTWAKLLALLGFSGLAAAWLAFLYATRVEPHWIEFTTQYLRLKKLSPVFNGYRIVQLSDLHLGKHKLLTTDRLDSVIQQVNALHPDAILITGDFVTRLDEVGLEGVSRLRMLEAPDGVFGILGNHDYWSGTAKLASAAEAAGVQMLLNQHVVVRRRNAALVIAGMDDIWHGDYDLGTALRGIPTDAPVVLMAHEPNYADFVAQDGRVDLQLSGHSHGGQIRIPGLGPLALPEQAWRYPMGLYRVGKMWLYVSRGIGVADIPVRFNCRPEITTFILSPERQTRNTA